MRLEKIYEPYIYSIKYEGQEDNEFDRLFDAWSDMSYLENFMMTNKKYLDNPIWGVVYSPEKAAATVRDEANDLNDLLYELYKHSFYGEKPDFDSHFRFLDGKKYRDVLEYIPMKSYGTYNPSFIRIYAIKLKNNQYIITGGGIKLADSIQDSPDLKNHVIQNIDRVRAWLISNGIMDEQDI